MRKRIVTSFGLSLFGLLAGFLLGDHYNWNATMALVGGSLSGLVLGYCSSVVSDVFLADQEES